MFRGIRFALKRKLLMYRIVPKPPLELQCTDPSTVAVPAKERTILENRKFTHCCLFQPVGLNLHAVLKTIIGINKMESVCHSAIKPPDSVRGMTRLDKSKFDKVVEVPSLIVPVNKLRVVMKLLKHFQLKMSHLRPVVELTECDPKFSTHKRILLNPEKVPSCDIITEKMHVLDNYTFSGKDFEVIEIALNYENWNFQEVMLAIMPDDQESVAGFAQVGHIAHFNLRSRTLPFKSIIGEVLLDKLNSVKTVVNKLDTIDNTYRTFQMELLAGENNYITQTKENGITFELDFSKVYWNSRLGTEHCSMVKHLTSKDIVFDVFAGIGPFAVPAVKNKAQIFANDLNPSSYESLLKNVQLNKCDSSRIKCYNMDGREFITSVMKDELRRIYSAEADYSNTNTEQNKDCDKTEVQDINSILVLMNLPALAYTFLDAYKGLLCDLKTLNSAIPLPTVHCYCFTNVTEADDKFDGDVDKELRHRTISIIGCLHEEDISVRFVRDVAPKKEMKCLSFNLTEKILCYPDDKEHVRPDSYNDNDEPPTKSCKLEVNL